METFEANIESSLADGEIALEQLDGLSDLTSLGLEGISNDPALAGVLSTTLGLSTISTENLREAVTALYTRFIDSLVKAWDYLVTYVDSIYLQLAELNNTLEDLEDKAKLRVGSVPHKRTLTFTSSANMLTLDFKAIEPGEFIREVQNLGAILDDALLDHVSEVINASKFISPLVESLMTIDVSAPTALESVRHDARAIAKFGNEVLENLAGKRGDDVTATRSDLSNGNAETRIKRTALILGNKALFVKYGVVDKASLRGEGIPFFNAINTVFSAGLILNTSNPNKATPESVDLTTLSPDQVQAIVNLLSDNLKIIRRFRDRHTVNLKVQRKRYQQLRGKLSVMSKAGDNTEINLYLRRIGAAAMGLSRWYYDPFVPLIGHTLRQTRATIAYCDRSLKQWPLK